MTPKPSAEVATVGVSAWRDWLGVSASIMCALHCAAMPFVVGFLPLFGLSFFADPAFHQWMVAICLGLAVFAFVPGWRRHRRLSPALVAFGGLALIAVAAFAGEDRCCEMSTALPAGGAPGVALGAEAPKSMIAEHPAKCAAACASCHVADLTVQAAGPQPVGAASGAWPWVTPLGGALLVVAHLRNRYCSCNCGRRIG